MEVRRPGGTIEGTLQFWFLGEDTGAAVALLHNLEHFKRGLKNKATLSGWAVGIMANLLLWGVGKFCISCIDH